MKYLLIIFCLSSICISCVPVNLTTNGKINCAESEVLENGKCVIQFNIDCGNTRHGETVSRLRYESSTVAFGSTCQLENQIATCNDGIMGSYSGSYTFISCTAENGPKACGSISHGEIVSRVRYESSEVAYGLTCQSENQIATCNDGTMSSYSGSYTFNSCSVESERHPIYVTFSAHNEKESYWSEFVTDKNAYLEYRSDLIKRVKLLHSYNVSLNWETDMPVLNAIEKYELDPNFAELSETNGKNILKWMTEDMGMIVDPHIHPDLNYNLADIAHKIEVTLGARVSGVVGGIAVLECSTTSSVGYEYFSDWHNAIQANGEGSINAKNSNYVWQAEVIQGGAMVGHARDDASSGVWMPSLSNFSIEDVNSPFIAIGQGYSHSSTFEDDEGSSGFYEGIEYIKELLEKVEAGEFLDDQMLTASIHTRDRKEVMSRPTTVNTYDGLVKVLAELEPYVATGQIIIADYEQVANIWKTKYKSNHYRYSIDNFSIASFLTEQVANSCQSGSGGVVDCTISKDLNGDGTVDQIEIQMCGGDDKPQDSCMPACIGGGKDFRSCALECGISLPPSPTPTPVVTPTPIAPQNVSVVGFSNYANALGISWYSARGAVKYSMNWSATNGTHTQHGGIENITEDYVFINKLPGMTTYCVTLFSIGSDGSASSGKAGCFTPN